MLADEGKGLPMVGLALYLNGERSPLVIEARPVPEPGAVRRYPGGTEKLRIFRTLSREIPKCLAASRWLMPSAQARRTFRYNSIVKMPRPPSHPGRAKMADFCAARSATIPPPPWQTIAPSFPPAERGGVTQLRRRIEATLAELAASLLRSMTTRRVTGAFEGRRINPHLDLIGALPTWPLFALLHLNHLARRLRALGLGGFGLLGLPLADHASEASVVRSMTNAGAAMPPIFAMAARRP